MSDVTERLGSPPSAAARSPRRPRSVVTVAAVVLALAVSFLLIQWATGDGPDEPTATPTATATDPATDPAPDAAPDAAPVVPTAPAAPNGPAVPPQAGATRLEGPVPVGYPRTRPGAVAAATNYLSMIYGSPVMLTEEGREAVISAAAAPARAAELHATLAPGLRQVATALNVGPDGEPRAGALAMRVLPIGYEVVAHTNDAATISVWFGSLVGVAAEDSPIGVRMNYALATVELAWVEDDWKWAGVQIEPGPSPLGGLDGEGTPAPVMAAALDRYTPYSYGGV